LIHADVMTTTPPPCGCNDFCGRELRFCRSTARALPCRHVVAR
jgi:hypothetical protein